MANILSIPLPVTASGGLFNLKPHTGEPARFGIVLTPLGLPLLPPIILESGAQLRSDFGLDTVINDIPRTTVVPNDTTITSQEITLWGRAPHNTGAPFMRNPTSCEEKTTNFTAVPYSGSTATGSASFTTTGCDTEDFSPTFSARLGGQRVPNQPTTAITSIDQDLDEAGLLRAEVALPADVGPDFNLLGNRCSPADFQASACPPNSVMGSAVAASPLLSQPLSGNVVLVDTGGVPNIGLDLQGQLHLLLQGSLSIEKKVVFDGLPDIPISHFQLTFSQPPGLLVATRDLCVPPPPVFHADFLGYNGASTSVDSLATIDNCGPKPAATKCKKAKKKRKHRAAEAKKKHKKKCKGRKRKKRR